MVLLSAAERRSPYAAIIVPARFTGPEPTPLSPLPPDLGRTYARTELCRDCGQVPALRSTYPVEFRHHLISWPSDLLGLRLQLLQAQKRIGFGARGRPMSADPTPWTRPGSTDATKSNRDAVNYEQRRRRAALPTTAQSF